MDSTFDNAFFLNLRSAVKVVLANRAQLDSRLYDALEFYQQRNYPQTQSVLEDILQTPTPEVKNSTAYAASLLARCYASRGKDQEGLDLLESEEIARHFQGALATSTLYWLTAHFYKAQGRYSEAMEKLQTALDLVLTSTAPKNAFRIVSDLANVHLALGDEARAITLYESAISEYEEDADYKDALVRTRCNLASVYQEVSRNGDAINIIDELLELEEIERDWSTFVALKLNRAITLKALARMDESLKAYSEVRDLARAKHDAQFEARALIGLSEHARQGDSIDDALAYVKEAYEISEAHKLQEMILVCMKRIAVLQHANGKVDDAIALLRECFTRYVSNGNRREAIRTASDIVDFLMKAHRYEEALETLQESMRLQRSVYEAETERAVEIASVRTRLAKEKEAARVRDEERSRVLNAVMPAHIATRLTAGEREIVDTLPAVTIMFADVVGFTELVSSMSGEALLELLSQLFTGLDAAASRFGCERVKTIGDSYMAICGASVELDDHVERMARMALAIVQGEFELPISPSRLRIGINTGPVIAGVMDGQRISYDVWGDTVNVAARMEVHSRPGSVNCTEAVAQRIMHLPEFRLIKREPLNIHGKGLMTTYWIEST